ncbi:MAG: CAP domain-containing protein [Bdellovibrionales bacterium]|nr:CAP domain-containing protein [Bdellovibrionales bacterium]
MVISKQRLYLAVFIIAALALSAVARAQNATITSQTSLAETTVMLTAEEANFLTLINNFRRKLNLPELKIHAGLQAAAEKHAQWMVGQDLMTHKESLSHYGPTPTTEFSDRITAEGYADYYSIGENIACGNSTASDTFRQWAFSPTHLSNMMSPKFHHLGIARAGTGSEDCPYYWTNDFGTKTPYLGDGSSPTISEIAAAIDSTIGPSIDGETAIQLLTMTANIPQSEPTSPIECLVPYNNGKNVVAFTPNVSTLMQVNPSADGYSMKLSFTQDGTQNRFTSYTISGVMVIKSPFYPLITIFSAPNSRVNGFMVQIDVASGRAQFDPYGKIGASGMINCKVKM